MTFGSSERERLAALVRVSALLWLALHFALTVAYLAPVNPVTLPMQPLLDATIGTYFEQNWGMFAPNPRSADVIVLVRPLSAPDGTLSAAGNLPADGWYDVSTPLWEGFQQNRLSAYDRLTSPQSRAVLAYLNGGPELARWREACQRGDAAACAYYQERLAEARARAGALLARVGSAFLLDSGAAGPDVTHVALRAREPQPVPWSERYTGVREFRDLELGIYPIERHVATIGLFRGEQAR